MFSSLDEVYDVSRSWNYILLSVTNDFGSGKWAKIERNDGKLLWLKASPVDWRIYTWEQWVSKNNTPESYRLLLYLRYPVVPPETFPPELRNHFARWDHLRFLVNQTKSSRYKTTTIPRFATLRHTRLDWKIERRIEETRKKNGKEVSRRKN